MRRHVALVVEVVLVSFWGSPLAAQTSKPAGIEDLQTTINELKERLKEQERRLADLEAGKDRERLDAAQRAEVLKVIQEINADAAKRDPLNLRFYWKDGIQAETADRNFTFHLGGRLHTDWFWISGREKDKSRKKDMEDGVEVRHARLEISGTVYQFMDYKLDLDFAGAIETYDVKNASVTTGPKVALKDAYIRFTDLPFVGSITAGHFKEPFGLEELTSNKFTTFIERALPTALVPAYNQGVMLSNAVLKDAQKAERMTYAAGVFRDTNDSGYQQGDGGYNMTARVTGLPWHAEGGEKLFHVGAAYSLRHPEEPISYVARPEAHLAPKFADTGKFLPAEVNLFGGEAALVCGPFSMQSEYISSAARNGDVGNACFNAFYIQVSCFLTGEHRNYRTGTGTFDRVRPKKNFRQNGGLGAWELAARYSYLDLDAGRSLEGGRMQDGTVGLNWYLNRNMRVMWNYIHSCASTLDEAADIFMTRVALDF